MPPGYAGPLSKTSRRNRRRRTDRNGNGIPDADERRAVRPSRTSQQSAKSPATRSIAERNRDGGGGGSRDGGSSTVPKTEPVPMEKSRTEFGRRFDSDTSMDVMANPEVIASEFMRGQGMDPLRGGGMTRVMNDLAAVMPDLFFLTQGGDTKDVGIGVPSFLDFAGEMLGRLSGTNKYIDPSVIGNLFAGGGADRSPLGAFLNDPNAPASEQVSRLLGLMGAGLQTTIPPAILNSIMSLANQQGVEFMRDQSTNRGRDAGTFADSLRRGTSIDEWFGF